MTREQLAWCLHTVDTVILDAEVKRAVQGRGQLNGGVPMRREVPVVVRFWMRLLTALNAS